MSKLFCSDCGWKGEREDLLEAGHPFEPPGTTVFGCPSCREVISIEPPVDVDPFIWICLVAANTEGDPDPDPRIRAWTANGARAAQLVEQGLDMVPVYRDPPARSELADLRCLVATYAKEANEAKAELESLKRFSAVGATQLVTEDDGSGDVIAPDRAAPGVYHPAFVAGWIAAKSAVAPVETRHYCQTCCGDGKYDRRLCGLALEADDTCVDCNGTGIEPHPRSSAATEGCGTPGCTDPSCDYGKGPLRCQSCGAVVVGEPQAAPEWQPIETAKHKDGTRILVWDGKEQYLCAFRGEHHKPHQDKPGWFSHAYRVHPTHWKPLGASPLTRPKSQ